MKDADGFKPLHVAASNGQGGIASLLFAAGAKVNVQNNGEGHGECEMDII